MIGDHHGRTVRRATLLVRATDEILGTHSILLLAVLVYAGIALPAVWSAKPCRRRAAAAVLGQILAAVRQVTPGPMVLHDERDRP
jgi:hypothetical protein